jgi:hypothetical protein
MHYLVQYDTLSLVLSRSRKNYREDTGRIAVLRSGPDPGPAARFHCLHETTDSEVHTSIFRLLLLSKCVHSPRVSILESKSEVVIVETELLISIGLSSRPT